MLNEYDFVSLGCSDEHHCNFKKYNKSIGVFAAIIENNVVFIGKATEKTNGGFRKRLRDFTRQSDSGRDYTSGKLINSNQKDIVIFIREVETIKEAENLKRELVEKFQPKWNR